MALALHNTSIMPDPMSNKYRKERDTFRMICALSGEEGNYFPNEYGINAVNQFRVVLVIATQVSEYKTKIKWQIHTFTF